VKEGRPKRENVISYLTRAPIGLKHHSEALLASNLSAAPSSHEHPDAALEFCGCPSCGYFESR
jgi:hypothetical protein